MPPTTLTEEQIVEGTKIIAEYIGLKEVPGYEKELRPVYRFNEGQTNWYSDNAKFHTSLDAINPVFKKVKQELIYMNIPAIPSIEYFQAVANHDIPACFLATVKAIELINKYKK